MAGVHLVTGGSGFLGSHTARALLARGERVRVLDVIDAPDRPAGIEFVHADIRDARAVRAAMDGVEVVHHHAAMVPLTKAGSGFREVNVDGTQHALDAACEVGARLFIHVSTSAVFGLPERCPITDATPLKPLETYGRAKLEGERRVERAAREGLPCAVVRPRTLIGTERLGIFQILFEWIQEGRRIYVIGDGHQRFQLLHVDDAVDFLLQLAEQRKTGIFNVGAEHFGTLREDLGALVRHAGTRARVTGIPAGLAIGALGVLDRLRLSPLAPWHYRTYHKPFFFDLTRPMREVGWRPRFSNVDALTQSYDWWVAHRDEPGAAPGRSTHRKSVRQGVLRLLKGLS
jgi:nucleoside-diphosphate-sugar epimerase